MASYRTVTATATIATNTVTANGEVSEHIFTANANGQQVIVTDPYVAVEAVEDGTLLTVRDAHEETQAVIYNGQKGDKGNPGVDGFSPIATVTKSGSVATIAITDENGTTTATVEDGSNDWNDLQNIPKMITNVTVTGGDGEVYATRSYNDGTFEGSIAEISGYVYTGTYGAHTLKLKRKNVLPDITVFTADTTPTSGSDQLVTSGGVYTALASKADTSHTHSQYLTEHQDISGKQDVLSAGDGISLTGSTVTNTQSIEYIVGTQTAATNAWTGVSKDSTLKAGKIIAYYLPYAGNSSPATLQLTMADGTTTSAIELRRTGSSTVTTHFAVNNVIIMAYDGTYWRVSAYYDANTNTVPTGYCTTAKGTAAKSATCTYGYRDDPTYFPCVFRYANTATNATLAISSYATDALPIYVNGARTTSSNTFGRGVIMFLYYNNAYYCYNDGRFPIVYNGAVTSIQDVLASLQS